MTLGKIGQWLKQGIELIGRHPLATGILALLGIAGFVLSVVSFQQDQAGSAATSAALDRNHDAITEVGNGVQAISAAIDGTCAKGPCWSLADLVRRDLIGKPKDLVDSKIAPAVRKETGQYIYDFDGCEVRIVYADDAVSYFSAALFKQVEDATVKDRFGNSTWRKEACPFAVAGLFPQAAAIAPEQNARLTVADAIRLIEPPADCAGCFAPELKISTACLDCGNAADPFLEFMRQGTHAEQFIDTYFMTTFDPVSGDDGYEIHDAFRQSMKGIVGPDAEFGLELAPLCGRDLYAPIKRMLGRSQLTAIGLGTGPRPPEHAMACKY